MNLINDIKEQKEYYYVNTKFNLNDLIIAVAFAMFATGFFGASFFLNTDIIFEICAILFLMPFAVFFVVRIIKLAITIQKMKSCTKKGATYYAKITDEIQGEKVFSLSNKYKK